MQIESAARAWGLGGGPQERLQANEPEAQAPTPSEPPPLPAPWDALGMPEVFRGNGRRVDPYASQDDYRLYFATPVLRGLSELSHATMLFFERLGQGTLDDEASRWFANETSTHAQRFRQDRQELVANHGLQTVYAVSGDLGNSRLKDHDIATANNTRLALDWARGNVMADADPLTGPSAAHQPLDASDVVGHVAATGRWELPPHRMRAVIETDSLKETIDLVLQASGGDPITDLIIAAHGSPEGLAFLNMHEQERFAYLRGGGVREELLRLRPVLAPGAQIFFTACALVEDEQGQEIVQQLADELGVRIYAYRREAPPWAPAMGDLISFYPRQR